MIGSGDIYHVQPAGCREAGCGRWGAEAAVKAFHAASRAVWDDRARRGELTEDQLWAIAEGRGGPLGALRAFGYRPVTTAAR